MEKRGREDWFRQSAGADLQLESTKTVQVKKRLNWDKAEGITKRAEGRRAGEGETEYATAKWKLIH